MALNCSSCNSPIPDDAKFCPVCGKRVDAPAPTSAPAPVKAATPAATATTDPAPATVIDGPRVLAGRFMAERNGIDTPVGTVHAATDLQNGGAAVRVLLVGDGVLPTAALVDRTLREWKQLGKVASARVLRIVDQGKLDDGRVYVATEAAKGESLAELIAREGPLSIERMRKLVVQIGEALAEAQKVGVIHRDVSPRTIFVADDQVAVADFGVAEVVADKVFGSPAYLSPEQAEGKPVDQRSNIYSLGALIHFMVTGKPPFEGDSQSLLAQHASATPQAPSTRRAGLPAEIDRIVGKALEKSGGRRHLTLRQLVTEVEAIPATGAPVRSEELGRATTLQGTEPVAGAANAGAANATMLGMPAPSLSKAHPAVAEKAPSRPADNGVDKTAPAPTLPDPPPVVASTPPPAARTVMAEAPAPKPVTAQKPLAPATAATMMAEAPAPKPAETPKPVMPAAVAAASAAAAAKKGGSFRETAWFKKGEIEEELAKAAAAHATEDPLAPAGTTGTHGVVDEAQLSVSAQDQQRLSLKTGATQMMPAIKVGSGAAQALPGERMDESEMLAEIDRSKRWFTIAGILVAVAVIGLVIFFMTRKSDDAPAPVPKAAAPAAPAAPTAATPTAPAPPVPAPAPPAADSASALLVEAGGAMNKGNWVVAVDALLRASRADGADPAQLKTAATSLDRSLAQAAAAARKRKDRVAEGEARALQQKLAPLLPAPAPKKKPARATARRR